MKVHEYQAKDILARYGVPVPRGRVTDSAEEAAAIAQELGVPVAVKAQIHAGGRGKGGGIKLAKTPDQGARGGDADHRHAPGHPPDGPRRTAGEARALRGAAPVERELYLARVIDS